MDVVGVCDGAGSGKATKQNQIGTKVHKKAKVKRPPYHTIPNQTVVVAPDNPK